MARLDVIPDQDLWKKLSNWITKKREQCDKLRNYTRGQYPVKEQLRKICLNRKEVTMPSGKFDWGEVKSPKEKEIPTGVYKGGSSQSQPKSPPKVD